MNSLPRDLIDSLQGIKGFDQEAFENVHALGEQVTSVRINPTHKVLPFGEDLGGAVPWTDYGYYLSERPSFTFDPLFHAGCYYVQEASGMFLEQALKQTVDLSQPIKVLDLCAAPGGKSTHIQSLISSNSLLVSNEVIKSRNNILIHNIIKWGCINVVVTQSDPKEFARLENYFDVIVADAPCSGSGLFRRYPQAMDEWSINNVKLCCQRQRRILADVLPALKKGGVLIYSTCSYSKEEDEDILDWIVEGFKVEGLRLKVENSWNIVETFSGKHNVWGYRFFPDKVKGEGFFIACFRKTEDASKRTLTHKSSRKQESLSKIEIEIIKPWIRKEDLYFLKQNNSVIAIREKLVTDFHLLLQHFRVSYFGTMIGDLIREKIVPHHALAMSFLIPDKTRKVELNYKQSIQYLKKKDLKINLDETGWALVTFKHQPLGWINVLPNRSNNYYPMEFRILKDR